jgi:hypothetical protein
MKHGHTKWDTLGNFIIMFILFMGLDNIKIYFRFFLQKILVSRFVRLWGSTLYGYPIQNIIFNVFNLKTSFGTHDFPCKLTPQPSRT